MNISRYLNYQNYRNVIAGTVLAVTAVTAPCVAKGMGNSNLQPLDQDKVVLKTASIKVSPKGTDDIRVLKNAPDPKTVIAGESKIALFVVDVSKNVLYHYDKNGKPICAYLIASGKRSTPTDKGFRIVNHIETYPYRTAPASTKRRKSPKDYGPKIIILNKLDPKTGEQSPTGEFIHGNRNAATLGKYVSHGCMRMDNEVIKDLAKVAQKGDIVIIK